MSKYFLQDPVIDILKKSLNATTLRHKTISNNIANVNTPNYKRQLVKFEEELQKHLTSSNNRISLARTKPNHISFIPKNITEINPELISDQTTAIRTDGNNVDIDLELAQLAENTTQFNVLSQAVSKKLSLLRSAIRGGR